MAKVLNQATKVEKSLTTTTKTATIHITDEDMLALLAATFGVDEGWTLVSATYTVPGGGNWSNTTMDLKEMDIDVVLQRTEEG